MADIKRKVPNLRFKGFTDDWEQHKLRDVADLNGRIGFRGYTRKDIVNKDKGILAFSPTNIVSNRLIKTSKDTYITVKKYDESPEIKLKNGYVLFVKTGSTLGKSALIKELSQLATVNPQIVVIKPKRINASFMSIILLNDKVQRQVFSRKIGGAVPTLTENEINNFNFNVPKTTEQQSISEIIECLNNFLSLQQRKLDLLKQLKKGFLQKMFAEKNSKQPVLRFKGFHDDWEGRKLENSADYIRGSFPQPYGNKEWYGGTNAKPFVQVVDVNTNMRLNKKTKEQISVLAQPKSRFVPSDSIVVTLQGSIGRVAITQYDSYVDRTLLIFTKYKVPVDKYFWAYSIQNIFRIEKQKAPGGTIKTITKRALSSFEVSLPVQEEQKKIGTLLKNIDDIITSQQEEVSKLKKIKKSLLQQMFI